MPISKKNMKRQANGSSVRKDQREVRQDVIMCKEKFIIKNAKSNLLH